jgi:hypothetical protein
LRPAYAASIPTSAIGNDTNQAVPFLILAQSLGRVRGDSAVRTSTRSDAFAAKLRRRTIDREQILAVTIERPADRSGHARGRGGELSALALSIRPVRS